MDSRLKHNFCLLALISLMSLYGITQYSAAQVSVLTHHNDNGRTGQNLNETALNNSNVNVSDFGKLFFRTVDQNVYAQPLYVPNLLIGGRTRNVLYGCHREQQRVRLRCRRPSCQHSPVAGESGYASALAGCVCSSAYPAGRVPRSILGRRREEIGITSTPVIDSTTNTLYVVAKTKDVSNSTWHFYLHALDLLSGEDKFGGPTEITMPANSPVQFVQLNQLQRPALILVNGTVYVMFGSAGDFNIWHGWVVAYDASTLHQLAYFTTTPSNQVFDPSGETGGGGIFAAGGPVADSNNNIYFMTGNGPFDNSANFGVSALKLSTPISRCRTGSLRITHPTWDQTTSTLAPADLMMIPGTSLLVGGGKDGYLRLIDGNNMGKFSPSNNNNLENFLVTQIGYSAHPASGTVLVANGSTCGYRVACQRLTSSTAPSVPLPSKSIRFRKAKSAAPPERSIPRRCRFRPTETRLAPEFCGLPSPNWEARSQA